LVALAAFLLREFSQTAPAYRDDATFLAIVVPAVIVWLLARRRISATELMAILAGAAAVFSDFQNSQGGALRDLHLYLNAGAAFVNGGHVYTTEVMRSYPTGGLEYLPFLYAPVTLPVFGALSLLPRELVDVAWVVGSVVAAIACLRSFGLSWRWTFLALAWTPVEQGLFVGNVASPSLLVMGLGLRYGGALVFGPLFKPQNGVVSLWLIRERAWRALAGGILALGVLVVATLPLTGIGLWRDWLTGMAAYQESEGYLQGLYGVGLGRHFPMTVFLAIAAFTIVAALAVRGREGLARLGLASVVASPSLWSHGYVFAIPAFLRLRAEWLWLVVGMLCVGQWPGPQLSLAVGVAAWFVKGLARDPVSATSEPASRRPFHPLGSVPEPWPTVAERARA
jgi:hypothetical protein